MWKQFIGVRSTPIKNYIEYGAIKSFAIAIGEPLSIYLDEQYAKTTPHEKIMAPPTFPRTLDYGKIEGLEFPVAGLLHGEQTFSYKRTLYAGDVIYCCFEVFSIEQKERKAGRLGILKVKQYGFETKDMKERIFTTIRTLILTEKLLKRVEE